MKLRSILQFMCFGILMGGNLLAEDPILKLDDLIFEAMGQNPIKRAAEEDALSYMAQIGPSGAYEDPMIAFEAKDYPVNSYSRNQYGMTGNEVSLTQKIPFPGKLSIQRSATRYEAKSKEEGATFQKLMVIRDVKMAFYDLFLAYKEREILMEQKNLVHQYVALARNRYAVGKIPQAELLNFQVEEAKLIEELLSNEKEISVQRAKLTYVLGRKDDARGKPEALRKTPVNFSTYSLEVVQDKAVNQNPLIKSAMAEVDSSKERALNAQLGFLPDFELMGAYTFREPSPGDQGVDFVSGKVGMTIPLWFLTKQVEEVKRAKAEKRRKEALLEDNKNDLRRKTKSIYEELKEAHQRLDLYETGILPLTRQAVLTGKSAYLSNRLDYLGLLTLVQNRFKTEYAYQEQLVNHETKIADLELVMGEEMRGGASYAK